MHTRAGVQNSIFQKQCTRTRNTRARRARAACARVLHAAWPNTGINPFNPYGTIMKIFRIVFVVTESAKVSLKSKK